MATVADRIEGSGTVSIGRIISRAFSFVMSYPLLTLGSAALFGALPSVLSQVLVLPQAELLRSVEDPATIGFFALQIVAGFVTLILNGVLQAIVTRGLVVAHEGGRPSFGRCLMDALRLAIPVVLLTVLWSFGLTLGFALLIVPGVILVCMWAVAIPALVEERTGIIGAFGRSRELTRGNRWKIFGLMLIVLIAFYLLLGLVAVLGLASGGGVDAAAIALSAVNGLIFGLLWATIQPSLFVELRDAKEGGSVGELAQVFS